MAGGKDPKDLKDLKEKGQDMCLMSLRSMGP